MHILNLVLHPVKACANLHELYLNVAQIKGLLFQKNLPAANEYADKVKQLYIRDSLISKEYNSSQWQMEPYDGSDTYWLYLLATTLKQKMPDVTYISEK
jgi:hypothetical protein